MAEIITGIDFKSKDKSKKIVSEGPFDFEAIEREIATALWAADFGGPIAMVCSECLETRCHCSTNKEPA